MGGGLCPGSQSDETARHFNQGPRSAGRGRPRPSLRAAVGLGGTRALAKQSKVCVTSALTPWSCEQRGTLSPESWSLPPEPA